MSVHARSAGQVTQSVILPRQVMGDLDPATSWTSPETANAAMEAIASLEEGIALCVAREVGRRRVDELNVCTWVMYEIELTNQ